MQPPGKRVFLIGYRGAGKTTVAGILAGHLGWGWLDADAMLEQQCGRNIRTIFSEDGEPAFRDKESAILEQLCAAEHKVIATGGGVVLKAENRQRLRCAGRVVWLAADAGTLWRRLQNDPLTAEQRPALSSGGLAEIELMLQVREPFYRECADLVVLTAGRSPREVALEILAQLNSETNDRS